MRDYARIDMRLRTKYLPVTFGFPFGLTLAFPANLPLPTKISTRVLEPIVPVDAVAVVTVEGDRLRPHAIHIPGVEPRSGESPSELIVRGFGEGAEPLLDELREEAARVLGEMLRDDVGEIKLLQEHLHDEVGQLVYDRTHRRPMILPVVVEV